MRTSLALALALALAIALALPACQPVGTAGSANVDPVASTVTPPGAASIAVRQSAPTMVEAWPLPAPTGAAQPDLVATPDGDLLLSWIQPDGEGHALAFARWHDGRWSAPRTIARGDDWFVNWADTPHLLATVDGALWAHWLHKSAAAPYAYDVALVRSGDGGASWSEPVLVNDDGTPTEHGFVSLWPACEDGIGVAWLDGRETGGHGAHDGHEGHDGSGSPAMTLRAARFDAALARSGEVRVDAMTCDCCQTDVAVTARGPLLVYRDRAAGEIRDIASTRLEGGRWTDPLPVHEDRWTMPACPVNGPSVDARGNEVVVGWYTAAGGTPVLKLARSGNAADHFGLPVVVDRGAAVQGRVDVALDDHSVWLLWTREGESGQSLQLARYAPDLSHELQRSELARLRGRGRGTGFAQLVAGPGGVYAVWTDVVDGNPKLHGARVSAPAPGDASRS
jgi:hypothetical protein